MISTKAPLSEWRYRSMDEPVYLDSGTLAQPSSYLINEMQPYLKRHWHALGAHYLKGKAPFSSIERCLGDIRAFIGLHEEDRFILSGCPLTTVYHSILLDHASETGKNHLLTLETEVNVVHQLGCQLEKGGLCLHEIPLNENGQATRAVIEAMLSPKVGCISLSWAHPLTGVIQPIWDIAELCKEKRILLHVDASAALGKIYFKFEEMPIDILTFDGTLLHGPKGSGGICVKRGVELTTIEEGEFNTAGLVGLGIAFQRLSESFDHLCMETARLRDRFETGITTTLKEVKVLFQEAERLPNTSVLSFPGISSELLAVHLREGGVFASMGGGRHKELKKILIASSIETFDARCALSFTLSRETTKEEIDRAIGIIVDAAQRCMTFSEGVL